jgi:hypothetical protein
MNLFLTIIGIVCTLCGIFATSIGKLIEDGFYKIFIRNEVVQQHIINEHNRFTHEVLGEVGAGNSGN